MDAKITKKRLGHMLSYDWLKIVGLAVAMIIFWSLVFTMTATRITAAQQFTVVNYFGNLSMTYSSGPDNRVTDAFNNNIFSYEVIETTTVDVPSYQDQAYTVLEARVATQEGDVVFVPDIQNEDSKYEVTINGEKEERYDSYLQDLVRRYGYSLYNLDPNADGGYFKSMENFLNRYYTGGYEKGELNKSLVEADFLARIQKNKDKRFKTDAQIAQGVQDEIKRVEKYRNALVEFYGYVKMGLVAFTHTTVFDQETGEASPYLNGIYSINLCPNKDTMGDLKTVACYEEMVKNAEGEDVASQTAYNMNVAFFRFKEVEESFEYENLLYVNYIIRSVKTVEKD